jgi:hypothetical protein
MDPLGHMMLGSEDYRYFLQVMQVRVEHTADAGHACRITVHVHHHVTATTTAAVSDVGGSAAHSLAALTAARVFFSQHMHPSKP